MATKIRLQRHGKKDNAFFHIVVADSRAPRDGAFIEKLGVYNPGTNPATIDINFDSALSWVQKGAVPTETCRAILSYKGVIYKNHLLNGVKKGALTLEQVESKFSKWLTEKETKISIKKDNISGSKKDAAIKRLEAEKARKEAIAAKVAAKATPPAQEEAVEKADSNEATPSTESTEENA